MNNSSQIVKPNFKERIRSSFPALFSILKFFSVLRYSVIDYFDAKRISKRNSEVSEISSMLIEKYGAIIQRAPFKGLKLPILENHIWHPTIILGTYEQELSKTIEQACRLDYQTQIHIGCGYGYFAVGMASLAPNSIVYAFDLNSHSIETAKSFANLNLVENIDFHGLCKREDLENKILESCLVFCDCEGAELDILDPILNPALLRADILVETHDHLVPGISKTLEERFSKTHKIEKIIGQKRNAKNYPELGFLPIQRQNLAIDELRHVDALWLWIKRKNHI